MEYITGAERAQVMGQEPYPLAVNEIDQAEQSGRDVTGLRERLSELDPLAPADRVALLELYDAARRAPVRPGAATFESSGLEEILAVLPRDRQLPPADRADLPRRLLGAWSGRVAGNMLGKPVEKGWPRPALAAYLRSVDAYPLRDYVPLVEESRAVELGFQTHRGLTRGRIAGGVRDDDVDYTILGLQILETYGPGFTTADVAYEWLRCFPVYQLYTAERAAYHNLVREVPLAEVGEHHNPYREWIGAQIRADVYGYVAPGRPRRAAELAHRDAVLSHRANGLYGAMWAAALVSAAFVVSSPEEAIEVSLEHVPPGSRLAVEVGEVLGDFGAGRTWEECLDRLDRRHAALSWVHVLNNTGALAAALLWGAGDFSATVGLAAQAGLDADSIGATAGSWVGAFLGLDEIPAHWLEPLHDRTSSAVFGASEVRLSDLAARTARLVEA